MRPMQTQKIFPKTRVLVIAPLYENFHKLDLLNNVIQDDDILIFLGDDFLSEEGIKKYQPQFLSFIQNKEAYHILGDQELLLKNKLLNTEPKFWLWLSDQYLAIQLCFESNTNVFIAHGGLIGKTIENMNNMEISFINSKDWHLQYNGDLGFVITSNPNYSKNQVEIYNYSASLDTRVDMTNILAIQEITKMGLGKTFYI